IVVNSRFFVALAIETICPFYILSINFAITIGRKDTQLIFISQRIFRVKCLQFLVLFPTTFFASHLLAKVVGPLHLKLPLVLQLLKS
ncbi:MAG: hypothetical protein DI538_29545, partial [Azospira oryzae]